MCSHTAFCEHIEHKHLYSTTKDDYIQYLFIGDGGLTIFLCLNSGIGANLLHSSEAILDEYCVNHLVMD